MSDARDGWHRYAMPEKLWVISSDPERKVGAWYAYDEAHGLRYQTSG